MASPSFSLMCEQFALAVHQHLSFCIRKKPTKSSFVSGDLHHKTTKQAQSNHPFFSPGHPKSLGLRRPDVTAKLVPIR